MLVKFFSNKKGGSTKAVDYLLNEREKLKTARTLQGDPNITKSIINSIQRKQKVTVGCLSFEEKNISEEKKYELMKDFEKTLLPNLEERYNILWVEHTDKGRLELNFVIPKTDLETNKALQPYYYKEDQKRVELFQKVKNLEYGFSSPDDPSKARTVEGATKKLNLQQDYEQLDKLLHSLVEEGTIKNRKQLIELLEDNNIKVNRKGKDYIAIKLPESKRAKRFKGSIYNEQFTSVGELREVGKRTREEINQHSSRDTSKVLEHYQQELDKFTQYKLEANAKRYPKAKQQEFEELGRDVGRDNQKAPKSQSQTHSKSNSDTLSHDRNSSDLVSDEDSMHLGSSKANEISIKRRSSLSEVHERRHFGKFEQRQHLQIHSDKGVAEDDSTGATAIRRIGAEREKLQRYHQRARISVDTVHQRANKSYEDVRAKHGRHKSRLREDSLSIDDEVARAYVKLRRRRRRRRELKSAVKAVKAVNLIVAETNDKLGRYIAKNLSGESIRVASYQQKIVFEKYRAELPEFVLRGYYIETQTPFRTLFKNSKKGIEIQDTPNQITAQGAGSARDKAILMINLAKAKGWNLEKLEVTGSEEFKRETERLVYIHCTSKKYDREEPQRGGYQMQR